MCSIKRALEIRKFHITGVQLRLRNVQKSVMHVQSCCFAILNLLLFAVLVAVTVVVAFSSILLWSTYFATMVTWCASSSLYWRFIFFWLTATNSPEAMMESDDDYNFDSDFSWRKTPPHLKGHLILDIQQTRFQDEILIVCVNHLFILIDRENVLL